MSQLPQSKRSIYWYLGIVIIILSSFLLFSYRFYPFFNSDAALAVLMAFDFHWPADIYCWGQNRGGTLEMLIGNIFISTFHLNALITASVIHYLLFAIGLIASFSFIKSPSGKFALSVLWFFPSYSFLEILLYQFCIQFSLLMIALAFLKKTIGSGHNSNIWLSLMWFFMFLSAWTLDLGVLPILFLLIFLVLVFFIKKPKRSIIAPDTYQLLGKTKLMLSLFWIIIGTGFIIYAKYNAVNTITQFDFLPSFNSYKTTYTEVSKAILGSLTFKGNFYESLYFYSLIFLCIMIMASKGKSIKQNDLFKNFFIGLAIFAFVFIMILGPAFTSSLHLRYFSISYFSLTIYLILVFENKEFTSPVFTIGLIILLCISVYSSVYNSFFPKRLPPMVNNFESLDALKPCGIIGSYWHSYLFSSIDPEKIIATPNDRDLVRNSKLAFNALQQPKIILIKNEWLNEFPDTIIQFGTRLIKKGNPFLLGTYYSWDEKNEVEACIYNKY